MSALIEKIHRCFPRLKEYIIQYKARPAVRIEDLYYMYEELHVWIMVNLLSEDDEENFELYYTFIKNGISSQKEMADMIIREYWKSLE